MDTRIPEDHFYLPSLKLFEHMLDINLSTQTLIFILIDAEIFIWVFLFFHLTLIGSQSRRFPTVLLPEHVHSNKINKFAEA